MAPLPPQVIDQLSREPSNTPGWSGRLIMFSATVFFLSLVGWIGLSQGYVRYLSAQDADIQKQLNSGTAQVAKEKEAQVIGFYSQLENLKKLLDSHVYASNLLAFLERNTHPNVYFAKLDFNSESSKVVLSGVARSVKDATEQAQIFEGSSDVANAALGAVNGVSDGTWQFDVILIFKKDFLTQPKMFDAAPAASSSPTSSTAR